MEQEYWEQNLELKGIWLHKSLIKSMKVRMLTSSLQESFSSSCMLEIPHLRKLLLQIHTIKFWRKRSMISFGRLIQERDQLDSSAITSKNSSKVWLPFNLLNASRSKILPVMLGWRSKSALMHKLKNNSKPVNKS